MVFDVEDALLFLKPSGTPVVAMAMAALFWTSAVLLCGKN